MQMNKCFHFCMVLEYFWFELWQEEILLLPHKNNDSASP